jgi:hypothetical protein
MGSLRDLWEKLRGQESGPPSPEEPAAVEPESKPPAPKPLAPDEEAQERESQELRAEVRARDHEKVEGEEKPPLEYEEN